MLQEDSPLQRQTTIAAWCERIIEGGWLLAVILIPTYFNLLSARHFEPDKATTLRAIVLIMAAAGIVRALEGMGRQPAHRAEAPPSGGILRRFWSRLNAIPIALPALIYALVFLLTTFTSVVPRVSFWGSYQRLQGTYTNISYIGLGAMIVLTLRRREQLERLIIVAILSSLIAVGYGLVQHFEFDPLPWRGDVVSRVASTMGNSIFVAAYLIMILPFTLYRAVGALSEARRAPASADARTDWGWAAAYVLLVAGALLLTFASIKFSAVVRTADLRYWWVYPGALTVALALYILPTLRLHSAERISMAVVWPAIIMALYILMVGFAYVTGQGGGQVVQPNPGRGGVDWPMWLLGSGVLVGLGYTLIYTLPRRVGPISRLMLQMQAFGMLLITVLLLVTIFFTQSRGPWIGLGAGLFVFFTLLLIQAQRRARAGGEQRARLWRSLLIGEVMLALAMGGFLVVFNLSDAPVFQQLRNVTYIGRMGRLLETETGTGLVRRLIWIGDDKAGGAVALITADPLRTIIGWGPESMFVAYNPFYPPALANIESRGASPDRSHEAYLDELVTKGLLGLVSYLFVLISFFALAWRLIRHTDEWRMQVLFIACISGVAAHSVEGLTGIPIVSTLMMLWVTIAILVVSGALAGQYSLDAPAAEPAAPLDAPATAPVAKGQGAARGRGRQGAAARGATQGRAVGRRSSRGANPAALIVYGIIGLMTLAGVWFFNIDNVYADMRFQQGQIYIDSANAGIDQQFAGMSYLLDAIRMEPEQDFYYLNLGRSLMNIVDIRRQTPNTPLGQPKPDARVEDLLRQPTTEAAQVFIYRQTPLETMSYARAVLERARELNELNKDHYANLARMYSFWYSRLTRDPAQLAEAAEWYRKGHEIAPQDVTILNEYAGSLALQGSQAQLQNDSAKAQSYFEQARQTLEKSKQLDPLYADTDLRLAELLRLQGRSAEATDQYIALIQRNPRALDSQIGLIIEGLRDQPELLRRLRDAYAAAVEKKPDDATLYSYIGLLSIRTSDMARAAEAYAAQVRLQPGNFEAHRNYTLALSDTRQYQQAVQAAQSTLALAQQQQRPEQERATIEGLLNYLRTRATGG